MALMVKRYFANRHDHDVSEAVYNLLYDFDGTETLYKVGMA